MSIPKTVLSELEFDPTVYNFPLITSDTSPLRSIAPGSKLNYRRMMNWSRSLRDEYINQFRILPGAVNAYVEIVSSKTWMLAGHKLAVVRGMERLHESYFVDDLGIEHTGWQNITELLCRDWLYSGRMILHSQQIEDMAGPLEYIDSTYLTPYTYSSFDTDKAINKTVWRLNRATNQQFIDYNQNEIFYLDNITMGYSGLVQGSVPLLLPVAYLDYLVQEHFSAKLDGRKLNDILVVLDNNMAESLQKAFDIAKSNFQLGVAGAGKQNVGVVAVNPQGLTSVSVQDVFARLGLSEIPDNFEHEVFTSEYVREISNVLGLGPSYFWVGDETNSRSSDYMNEERQMKRGPFVFLKKLERLVNDNNLLATNRNSIGRKSNVRLIYEPDQTSVGAERKAKTFGQWVGGMSALSQIEFTEDLKLGQFLAFLQKENILPTDFGVEDLFTLDEFEDPHQSKPNITTMKEKTDPMDMRQTSEDNTFSLNYDEIVVDQDGKVLEKRNRLF